MSVDEKAPWMQCSKLTSAEYCQAKLRLEKKNSDLSPIASALPPKKRSAAEAKATAKMRVVSKAKVSAPAKVKVAAKAKPKSVKVKPAPAVRAKVTRTPARARGAVAKLTAGATGDSAPEVAVAKTTKKVCMPLMACTHYTPVLLSGLV